MWCFVLVLTASLEEEYTMRKKAHFVGVLNLYWSCLYAHRNAVHSNMTDKHVALAKRQGSDEKGYMIQVSTVQFITNALLL